MIQSKRRKRRMMFVSAETKQEKREDAFHADINIKRDDHHFETQAVSAQVSGQSDDRMSFIKRQPGVVRHDRWTGTRVRKRSVVKQVLHTVTSNGRGRNIWSGIKRNQVERHESK